MILEYQNGNLEARKIIIERNLKLFISIAYKYIGNGLNFLDLIQVRSIGLMMAIEKFDLSKECKLSTYATWWIRQAIIREINNKSRMIKIPVYISERILWYKKMKKHCSKNYLEIRL